MDTKKLMLMIPNFRWVDSDDRALWHIIPYNLSLLASMVSDLCEVDIIDAYTPDMSREQVTSLIRERNPDWVGITIPMDQFAGAGHQCAKVVKEADSGVTVIIGGVYATVNPDDAVRDGNIDYVVIGEGEYVLRNLLLHLKGEGPPPEKGIAFRSNQGIVNRGRADLIDDLDALPLPDYSRIDYASYASSAPRKSVDCPPCLPYGRIMTSRGCPQKCVFCQVETISGRKFRPRSAENVLSEIAMLKNDYGVRSLIFDDDNLFTNRKRAQAIFRGMIDGGLAMPWKSIATAVFHLDEDLLALMRDSGCQYICIAIESGVERVLKTIIRKPVDYGHAKAMVAAAKKCGIYVSANFIIGFPTETWDEIRGTLAFAGELDADYVKIFNAVPLKNTRLWDLCEKENAFRKGFSQETVTWNTGQIESDEFSADDLSILRAYEWDRINFNTPEKLKRTADMMHITVDELDTIRKNTLRSAIASVRKNG